MKGNILQPKQGDLGSRFNRTFKGMAFKNYDGRGGHRHTSWARKRRNREANAPRGGEQPKRRGYRVA